MKPWMFFLVLISIGAAAKTAAPKKAKFRGGSIYQLKPEDNKLLYTIRADVKPTADGGMFFSSRYLDANEQEALSEEAYFVDLNLQKYVIRQKQLNEVYELNISGNKMNFSVVKGGETKTKTRDLPDNLIVGPSFVPFFQRHWTEIQEKKKVEAQLAVLDYMDSFSFQFEKIGEQSNGVVVSMRPENPIVSAFVKPVYFLVQNDGSKIIELKGRMLLKLKVGTGWEDFEGRAVFTY